MEHARSQGLRAALVAFVKPAADRAWPFPHCAVRRTADAALERATLDVLGATARAWGLAGRSRAARQTS